MHPVELLELGQLRRRISCLRLEGRSVVDHQRQILMGSQHIDQLANVLFPAKIRLHQFDPQCSQRGQLRPLAAITARHLPTRCHQLFTEIKSESTAAARNQCTHTISFPFHGLT